MPLTLTAAEPLPDDLAAALSAIHRMVRANLIKSGYSLQLVGVATA